MSRCRSMMSRLSSRGQRFQLLLLKQSIQLLPPLGEEPEVLVPTHFTSEMEAIRYVTPSRWVQQESYAE